MNSSLSGVPQHLSGQKSTQSQRAVRGNAGHERAHAAVRVAIVLAVLGYLVSRLPVTFDLWPSSWFVFAVGFAVLSIAFLAFTYDASAPSDLRHTAMSVADITAVSYVMIATGEAGVPLFVLYLWITLAGGLRFGLGAVAVSAILSLLAFSAVVAVSPVWQQLGNVAAAIFISLIVLPAFSASFLRQRLRTGEEKLSRSDLRRYLRRIASVVARPRRRQGEAVRQSVSPPLQQRIRTLIGQLKPMRNDALGREYGQAVVRLLNSVVALAYLLVAYYTTNSNAGYPAWLLPAIGFIALSVSMLVIMRSDSRSSIIRRTAMNVVDVSVVTYFMVATGKIGIPLFIFYLSITLGNGFRFGLKAMAISAALCIIGFSTVLALSPVWKDLTSVSIAVMVVLFLLPFSASLLRGTILKRSEGSSALSAPSVILQIKALWQQLASKVLVRKKRVRRVDELGREQGQAMVRLSNAALALSYLFIGYYPVDFQAGYPDWLIFLAGFVIFALFMLALTLMSSTSSYWRRLVGNVSDVVAISYIMISTGEVGIPLFILYLSTTLANGFRFGVQAMMVSAVLSLVGFLAVIAFSPVWKELPVAVAVGVILSLILLPAYAAHLIKQLAKATKQAEEASAAKSHFLARMSHELRTPLTGILGTTELLAGNRRLTREDRSLLRVIKDSVMVSMRQIDNVLDFSKIEAGKLSIERMDFDLHEVLSRATRLVRAVALEKNLRLTLRIDPAIPCDLVGDPHHLNEVLLNLLSNALKFTEKGYVSLETRLLQADAASALIRFEVHDTGIGMEPAAIRRVFEAFSQADTSTTRRYGGTGLGTTIAKQLVELMGGQLRVESEKHKGTVFSADIRFSRQAERVDKGDIVAGGELAGARVLLVSREAALARYLTSMMEGWVVSLSVVPSVSEAVDFLARGIRLGNPIHAVLADGRAVFDANGTHCAADFMEKASLSATPVFLVCDVSPEEAQLRQLGYAAVLSYDVPPHLLFGALHSSYAVEAVDDRGVVQVEPWAWGQPGRSKPRVLVADDNRTNLMILRKILERANFEVETAENGNQALEMLQRSRYKVAVLDMHMPGRDGVEVMRAYRLSRKGARTPIVMLTANATMDAKVESADAGADAYLTKPATTGDVLGTIRKVLDETEVYELKRDKGASRLPAEHIALLNTDVVADLDRLYGDPADMNRLFDTFEKDSRHILHNLKTAAEAKDPQLVGDLAHALKGNSANIGALRMVQVCAELEHLGAAELHRQGRQMVERLESLLAETVQALREFSATGDAAAKSSPTKPAGPSHL